ncbi:MAG: DegT/DnrJ/EryC1/StrS family aminotransferase, partial [Pirellulales bacterium]|nr:DegT/DnrJ/EryC1/StrS family aminotransferase [Pirellulales bacterium]
PRTKAIMVVHMAGFPAPMDSIRTIAQQHHLAVVEDACHAIGARYSGDADADLDGRYAGTLGDVGCFSFFANKNLVTGEGGMFLTNDEKLAAVARAARSHGMTKTSWDKASGRAAEYDVTRLGFNYRCTELTAALGMIQLAKLDQANRRRRELVALYRGRLCGRSDLVVPFAGRLEDSAHHIFPIVVHQSLDRQQIRDALARHGIQTSVHYPPVHQFSHYQTLQEAAPSVDVTEQVAAREITLPLHPLLSDSDIGHLCDALEEELDKAGQQVG